VTRSPEEPTGGNLLLYADEDGLVRVQVRFDGGGLWLSQRQLADLFDKDVRTVSEHLQSIYDDDELDPAATIRKFRIVQSEGNRSVSRLVDHDSLRAVLAVEYRARWKRGDGDSSWCELVATNMRTTAWRFVSVAFVLRCLERCWATARKFRTVQSEGNSSILSCANRLAGCCARR
jgi:hypothetical protein